MTVDPSLQAQVDAQLLEQGAFAPLELLFNSGRLLYSDYESWRRRELDLLDSVLMGNRDRIKAEIEQAVRYARRMGLVEQPQEFHAWHTSDAQSRTLAGTATASEKPLRISLDADLQRLIGSRYLRAQNVPQMDLFFDNPIVTITTGIVHALAGRAVSDAQRLLDQLYAQAPNHPDLAAFDQLLAALTRLGKPVEVPRRELNALLDAAPTARRLLGPQWRDLMTPLWQQLARALEKAAYDPNEPDLHRSFALAQAQDWAAVGESVLGEPGWHRHAPLCLRLAESAFQRRRRTEALSAWCHVCWRDPANATAAAGKLRQADLTSLWQRLLDEESSLTEADFPAWLLLQEPGLALQLTEDLPAGDSAAEAGYRLVHRWLQSRRARRHGDEMELRRALQSSHPALFDLLKRTV